MDAKHDENKEFDAAMTTARKHVWGLKQKHAEYVAASEGSSLLYHLLAKYIHDGEAIIEACTIRHERCARVVVPDVDGNLSTQVPEGIRRLNASLPALAQVHTPKIEADLRRRLHASIEHYSKAISSLRHALADVRTVPIFLEVPTYAAYAWGLLDIEAEYKVENFFELREVITIMGWRTGEVISACREIERCIA